MGSQRTTVRISKPSDDANWFAEWVLLYWKPVLALLLVAGALVFFRAWRGQAQRQDRHAGWDRLREQVEFGGYFGPSTKLDGDGLAQLADALRGESSGPWARAIEVKTRLAARDYSGAQSALDALARESPEHALVVERRAFTPGTSETWVDHVRALTEERRVWEERHPTLFGNPAPDAAAPRVRIATSAGDLELALAAAAPAHCENFLAKCRDGSYVGTKFHRIDAGFMIQGGDPNSRDGAPETWGTGGTDELAFEDSGLRHFALALASAKKVASAASPENSSQFYITTAPAHHLDGKHSVFGVLIGGEDALRTIAAGTLAENTQDRPAEPVIITATEVL